MAPRPSWKGHLRLSLVSCPVRLYPAVSGSSRVSFHLLHKDTHKRINMRPYEPELGEVERSDLVKMHALQRRSMNRGFGLAQDRKQVLGAILCCSTQRRTVNPMEDLLQSAVLFF